MIRVNESKSRTLKLYRIIKQNDDQTRFERPQIVRQIYSPILVTQYVETNLYQPTQLNPKSTTNGINPLTIRSTNPDEKRISNRPVAGLNALITCARSQHEEILKMPSSANMPMLQYFKLACFNINVRVPTPTELGFLKSPPGSPGLNASGLTS